MKRSRVAVAVAVALGFTFAASVSTQGGGGAQAGPGRGTPPRQWWVNKNKGGQYGRNKPHIKLADLKARHKGQASWTEVVVEDENFHATYNSGAPGSKIAPRMHPDTRAFFVIVEGEMRFSLEGQGEPLVAKRGSVVNIPKKTMYSAEVVGAGPALWVNANQANFKPK
jgi:mannose-6-phosphate isomerase-like protein (cupin superfamily)